MKYPSVTSMHRRGSLFGNMPENRSSPFGGLLSPMPLDHIRDRIVEDTKEVLAKLGDKVSDYTLEEVATMVSSKVSSHYTIFMTPDELNKLILEVLTIKK